MSNWKYTPRPKQTPNQPPVDAPKPSSNSGFCTGMGSSWVAAPDYGSNDNVFSSNVYSQSQPYMQATTSSFPSEGSSSKYSSFQSNSSYYSQQPNSYQQQYNPRDPRQQRLHPESDASTYSVSAPAPSNSYRSAVYGGSNSYAAPAGYAEAPAVLPYSVPFTQPDPDPLSFPTPQIGFNSAIKCPDNLNSSAVRPPSNYPKFGSFVSDPRRAALDEDAVSRSGASPYDYDLPDRPPEASSSAKSGAARFLTLRQNPYASTTNELPASFASSTSTRSTSEVQPICIDPDADTPPPPNKQFRLDADSGAARRVSQDSISSRSSHVSLEAGAAPPAARKSGPRMWDGPSIYTEPDIEPNQVNTLCFDAASTSLQLAKLKAFDQIDEGEHSA